MDIEKLVEVVRICAPVFFVIGLGKVLSKTGFMTESDRSFITRLTYSIALPAIIFSALATEPFSNLFQPALFLGTVIPLLAVALLLFLIAKTLRLKGDTASSFIFSGYWANSAYVGFPLAASAFGAEGLSHAVIINAFCTPIFFPLSLALIGYFRDSQSKTSFRSLMSPLNNPIIYSILAGIAVSGFHFAFTQSGLPASTPPALSELTRILLAAIDMVGQIGLPLALIAVGGAMNFSAVKKRPGLLFISTTTKLILAPAIALFFVRAFFPETDPVAAGTLILLMSTPQAVASYVISRQQRANEEFVSTGLVLSTLLSIVTIPAWLYYIL